MVRHKKELRQTDFACRLHPAYTVAGLQPDEGSELCVQEAYTPESSCWGCGMHPTDYSEDEAVQAWATLIYQYSFWEQWSLHF